MEVWKLIYDCYEVSNLGNVRSLKHNKQVLLKPHICKKGYNVIKLRVNNESKSFKVHRLVAMAFIPNTENKEQVNHINGVKLDNRVENLEWVTNLENIRHAYANNLMKRKGVNNSHCKLKETDVIFIRQLPLSLSKLAYMFGVKRSAISKIKKGVTWEHI